MPALLLLLALAQGVEVTGLRAGESAIELESPVMEQDAARARNVMHIRPRVLDAFTGVPVDGVLVETWTEDGVAPLHVQTRVDFAVTGRDGCARVILSDGKIRAEKVRLSKPGYASSEIGASDAYEDEVPMYAAWPFEGRVLDLEGRPVTGALVRTRFTCAHAIPASQTRTDALGRFRMEDFPPLTSGTPQVEIVSPRHTPLFEMEADDLRRQASFYGSLDFYVARQRPTQVQLVDGTGAPIANRRVIRKEAPTAEAWTDEDGRCTLPPGQYDAGEALDLADPIGKVGLYPVLFVDGMASLVSPAFVESDVTPEGRITVRLASLGEAIPPPIVFVPQSLRFFDLTDGRESKVPIGRGRVVVGGDFSGFVQTTQSVEVTKQAQEVSVTPEREPRLRIGMVDPASIRFVVQAGDHASTGVNANLIDDEILEMGVPAGQPITVLWRLDDGGLRRASVPPLEPDGAADVDLGGESSILRHGMSEAAEHASEVRFIVVDRDGQPAPAHAALLTNAEIPMIGDAGGLFRVSLPAHTPYHATITAPGFTPVYLQGVVRLKPDVEPRKIVMTRRSRLELRGDVSFVDVCGGEAELTSAGYDLDVAAGPLTLVVERSAGPPIALDLVLQPGETRRIEVR